MACVVDDSDDIRLQRRKLQRRAEAETGITLRDIPITNASPLGEVGTFNNALPSAMSPPAAQVAADTFFDLNTDSVLFLDQIFMGNIAVNWDSDTQIGLHMDFPTLDAAPAAADPAASLEHYRDLCDECSLSVEDFIVAIRAYFQYTALSLPIIFEDALWNDVQAQTASRAFICAIACQGMPFTDLPRKWEVQQRLAGTFKRIFLQDQHNSNQDVSLDHVQALTIMVGFPYEGGVVAGLEGLFLSGDALVLMTLQLRSSARTCKLSRAQERQTLLFWHVYGLDALTSLDYKKSSRIPEADADHVMKATGHGYLDAVLSLSLVARKILQRLCEAARAGITYADVDALYKLLEDWKNTSCPPRLQHCNNDRENFTDEIVQLQKAVLHLLRINCYMQIENWVEEHGVSVGTLSDEMTRPRVELESLRALKEGTAIAQWMDGCYVGGFAVVDLAPKILRDICTGLGAWACHQSRRVTETLRYRTADSCKDIEKNVYRQTAVRLRSIAARAVSHCDTAAVLARMDEQMGSLET